jgi:hypothetical protein
MKRLALLLSAVVLLAAIACSDNDDPQATGSPTPGIEVEDGALERAALTLEDLGQGWQRADDTAPVTLQIGGRVGPSNIKDDDAEEDVTTAFEQSEDTGYVSNSIFLLENADIASAWIDQHREATDETWTQERMDGGGARYTRSGEVGSLPSLGDETFSATVDAVVEDAQGAETQRKIEYVVYRIDRILGFVVAQDVGAGTYVRKQEQKVASLVS